MTADRPSAVRIAVLFPELLGTYGDYGNAIVLRKRLSWREMPVSVTSVGLGEPVPADCDIYLLGGGEDRAQTVAADGLARSDGLQRAVSAGAAVLGVCAGFQLLGTEFRGVDGHDVAGLGLLDVRTRAFPSRAVGEAVIDATEHGLGLLTGFENHRGTTTLGAGVSPLGRVQSGIGSGDGSDGAVSGRVVATYLHGPVLARNPLLADRLLSWVVGPLPALPVDEVDALRRRRLGRAALQAEQNVSGRARG